MNFEKQEIWFKTNVFPSLKDKLSRAKLLDFCLSSAADKMLSVPNKIKILEEMFLN